MEDEGEVKVVMMVMPGHIYRFYNARLRKLGYQSIEHFFDEMLTEKIPESNGWAHFHSNIRL